MYKMVDITPNIGTAWGVVITTYLIIDKAIAYNILLEKPKNEDIVKLDH